MKNARLRPIPLLTAASVTCLILAGCPAKDAVPAAPAAAPPAAAAAIQPAKSAAKGTTPADRDAADADGVVRRGEAIGTGETLAVSTVFEQAADLNGKTVKVTGQVGKVCANKGCWMVIRGEGDSSIRITAKDYGFFVPHASVGMTAVVEGQLEVKTLDQKEAQHFADDEAEATGKPAAKIEGPVNEIGVVARGVEMRKS